MGVGALMAGPQKNICFFAASLSPKIKLFVLYTVRYPHKGCSRNIIIIALAVRFFKFTFAKFLIISFLICIYISLWISLSFFRNAISLFLQILATHYRLKDFVVIFQTVILFAVRVCVLFLLKMDSFSLLENKLRKRIFDICIRSVLRGSYWLFVY